jgi:hypothetical protein
MLCLRKMVGEAHNPTTPHGGGASAQQGNAVDAFGPEPVRFSNAPAGLGATDCCR